MLKFKIIETPNFIPINDIIKIFLFHGANIQKNPLRTNKRRNFFCFGRFLGCRVGRRRRCARLEILWGAGGLGLPDRNSIGGELVCR